MLKWRGLVLVVGASLGERFMFSGVLALLERSLRVDSRAWGPHLARFGLMIAIYIAVCFAVWSSTFFGAPGFRFFRSIAYLNLVFMTLMGISFFSTAITEEKEEDTLGLMLMAGISPLGILLGKSVARLVQALLLITVQYPFTLLAVTLGGIVQSQVRAVYVAMLAYMFMLAGVGLLCSTVSHRNRSAAMRFVIFLGIYFFVPSFCRWLQSFWWLRNIWFSSQLAWIGESCVFLQIDALLATSFDQTSLTYQVLTNASIGALGFGLSWAFFPLAVREPATEASTRGLVTRSQRSTWLFAPGRTKFDPFIWKDFYFVSGGVAGALIRVALYPSLYLLALAMTGGLFGGGWGPPGGEGVTGVFLFLTMTAMSIDAALLVSRSLHEEVRGQTLATLLMLPTPTGIILYSKIIGSLLNWLPGPAYLFLGICVLPYGFHRVDEVIRHPGPWFWLISHLILIPNVAALAALIVRWGALPLAIAIAIGSIFLSGGCFATLRVRDNDPIVFIVGMLVLVASLGCHVGIWLRAESLSAR